MKNKEEIAKRLGDAWLDIYIEDEEKLFNPLNIPSHMVEEPHLYISWLMSQPEYFSFICKEILGITIFPTQALVLRNMWNYKMLMMIASRGFSKTFMAAVYILLRLMLLPERKMVICGAGFRQSKFVFDYIEKIWNNSPILRDMAGHNSGPRKDPDVYSFRLGDSMASFIPIGTGDKIRGLRSNDTFCLTGDSLVQTECGLIKIKDYTEGNIVNRFGELERPSRFIVTPPMDVYKVTTKNGFTFKSSGPHMVMTRCGWKSVLDLDDDYIELDTTKYFPQNGKDLLTWPADKVKQYLIDNYDNGYSGDEDLITSIHISLLRFGILGRKHLDKTWKIDCELNFGYDGKLYDQAVRIEKLDQEVLYDFTMPKSHSFCANGIINHNCDEFHSINVEIFENVIVGFSAVSSDPVENIKRIAEQTLAKQYNIELESDFEASDRKDNQLIVSGTAYYQFNHFYKYWLRYKNIIQSRGNPEVIKNLGVEEINWRDYCIIRIPYELIPKGFMDTGIIANAKMNSTSISYALEYGAVFSADSNGFFRRSLLEQCTSKQGQPDSFTSMLSGDPEKQYIIGIDPAFRVDNFGLVLLELNKDSKRVVYVWTSNTKEHQAKLEKGIIKENEFYVYCVQHIRQLMRKFNVVGIAIDSQGGGWAISEMLGSKKHCNEDELPIFPMRDPKKTQPTDNKIGLHILDIVNFANYEYLSTANHTMRQDFEIGNLMFPYFDTIRIALESNFDKIDEEYNLEDCMDQIEELKNELCSIVVSETTSGKEHWDTPETIENGKKGRMRKDRYSALLIANALANRLMNTNKVKLTSSDGGFAEFKKIESNQKFFQGSEWLSNELNNIYKAY